MRPICLVLPGMGRRKAVAAHRYLFLIAFLIGIFLTGGSLVAAPSAAAGRAPSAAWAAFFPADWLNVTPLSAGITVSSADGFDTTSALFRTSTDGGATWTGWSNTGLVVSVLNATTLQITANGITLPDSAQQNRIQFRVSTLPGAVETSDAYLVRVDTTPPAAPFGMVSSPAGWSNLNRFRETWSNPTDLSGIGGAYYRLDSLPVFPTDGDFITTTTFVDNVAVAGEGKHHIFVWLVDGAGNVDQRNYGLHFDAFRYDPSPPIVAVASSGPLGQNGWYTGTVTVNFTPVDSTSGLASWGWRLDNDPSSTALSTQISALGQHSMVVNAADQAGNVMQPINRFYSIDPQAPLLGTRITPQPSATGWYTAPIHITFAVTDTVSGPAGATWQLNNSQSASGTSLTITDDGQHTMSVYGRDMAGNHSTRQYLALPMDSHAPVTTLTVTPPQPQPSGYYTQPVAIQFQATDPGSGSGVVATRMRINDAPWQAASAQAFTVSDIYTISYYSLDAAGNAEISTTRVISVDLDGPGAPVATAITPSTWTATNHFSVSWQLPVSLSGISGVYAWIGQGAVIPAAATYYASPAGISSLQVPGEGEWPLWLALVDGAGNRGSFVNVGMLRYDATAPQLVAQPSGVSGNSGWFTGPVQLAVAVVDSGSGPATLRYRVNGGSWQTSTSGAVTLSLSEAGRHVIESSGTDRAGYSTGAVVTTVIRIDDTPPPAPVGVIITPADWSRSNQWTVSWRNPADTSGIALVRWSLQAPANAQTGTALPAAAQTLTLQAPAEGTHSLYLWLEDVAGNSSLAQMVVLDPALRYDHTAPAVTLSYIPQPNSAGWFNSAVQTTIQATDAHSGVISTTWQLDNAVPQTGTSFVVESDGLHTAVIRSLDRAGNPATHNATLRIDRQPPLVSLAALSAYQNDTQIAVTWSGNADTGAANSPLVGYDVQVKQGAGGTWQPWLSATTETGAIYAGTRGQLFSFRVRAADAAGNLSAWSNAAGRNSVFVDPVVNGFFSSQNLSGWNDSLSTLGLSVVADDDFYPNQIAPAARLGSTVWEACSIPGNIPTLLCGDSWSAISQQIAVPAAADVAQPVLEFWYRIQSYDQITTTSSYWNTVCPQDPQPPYRLADSLDVTVQRAGSPDAALVLRDGASRSGFTTPIPLIDLKWRRAEVSLSGYAGETITLSFALHNRLDSRFNTWADIYGVRVRSQPRRVFLPLVATNTPRLVDTPLTCTPNRQAVMPGTPETSNFSSALPAEDATR